MNKKGLTLTMIFEASSLNYGESDGNFSSLKKKIKADGELHTYVSSQALKYSIKQQMCCDNTPVDGSSGVVQYAPETTIDKYPEIDLFGYLKTEKGSSGLKRSAKVRVSTAESLTPYEGETDFLNNSGLAVRCGEYNALSNSEIHNSMYAYTVTIDLDEIGIDEGIEIPTEEKIKRIHDLLDTLRLLHRDIKGRTENLNPIFAVGGIYDSKNPFFLGSTKVYRGNLDCDLITATLNNYEDIKKDTHIAALAKRFENEEAVNKICTCSLNELFSNLKEGVKEYYEGNKD